MTAQPPSSKDENLFSQIGDMVAAEKELRAQIAEGHVDSDIARRQLTALETELDRCWDLLRQRRAKEEFHEDPRDARVRPASEVEGYLS